MAEDNNNLDNEEEEVDEDDKDDRARLLRLQKEAREAFAELSDDDVTEDDDTGALPLPPPSPPLPPVESMDGPPEPPEMVLDTALDSPVDELNQLRDPLAVETADAIAASTAAHEGPNDARAPDPRCSASQYHGRAQSNPLAQSAATPPSNGAA